jgi:type I restriction enzyme, S subunit
MSTSEQTVTLADLADLIGIQTDPRDQPEALYIGLEHVGSGRFIRVGGGIAADVQSSKFAFKQNDVLYGKLRPYLDKAVLAEQDGVCTTELLVLRAKKGIDPRFLIGVVHCRDFIEHAVSGTTGSQHPRTSWHRISEFELPNFTPEEQSKIADLTWTTHNSLLACEEAIDAGTQLKREAMRELFTRGLRGEAQEETEIGLVPESWALTPAEHIFKLTSGKTRPDHLSQDPTNEKPFPVLGGNGVMGYSSEWHLDSDKILVIGRVGEYCGAIHFASGKVWITDNALYVKEWLNSSANIGYIAAFLRYFELNRFKRMAGQPLVTQGMINEHSFPLPSLDEQREIVEILDAIDRKIDLHKRKRAILEELFKTLLHKLMTGEIRVADLDLSALEPAAKAAE